MLNFALCKYTYQCVALGCREAPLAIVSYMGFAHVGIVDEPSTLMSILSHEKTVCIVAHLPVTEKQCRHPLVCVTTQANW